MKPCMEPRNVFRAANIGWHKRERLNEFVVLSGKQFTPTESTRMGRLTRGFADIVALIVRSA